MYRAQWHPITQHLHHHFFLPGWLGLKSDVKKNKTEAPQRRTEEESQGENPDTDTGGFRDSFSLLNHWKFQTYQTPLPGFILHAVTGTNTFYKYLRWKPVKGPNILALGLLTKSALQLMYLENSFLTVNVYFVVLRWGISLFLPKYRVSPKLTFQNCFDTALPEWKSFLLPVLPLYKNNYIPAKMSINNWQIKSSHIFHQVPYHGTAVTIFLMVSLFLFNSWLAEQCLNHDNYFQRGSI